MLRMRASFQDWTQEVVRSIKGSSELPGASHF